MKKKNIIKISAIVFSIILVIVAITTTTQSYFNKDNYAKNPTEYQTDYYQLKQYLNQIIYHYQIHYQ